jgi:MoaA/NifB/PqqE/SkfB family radical SAM enzyme
MPNQTDAFILNKEKNKSEIFKETILKSKPRMLFFILTTKCNLNCIMCLQEKGHSLPFEVFDKLRSLFPYLELIDWQGGEVFLIDYFKDLFQEIKTYSNIKQRVYTNGITIDKEWANILSSSHTEVTISIDAVTKKTYESIRRGAKFEDLLNNVETLNAICDENKSYIKLCINTVVMKRNLKELNLFPAFCKKYKIGYVRFDFLKFDNQLLETGFTNRSRRRKKTNPIQISKEDIFIKKDNTAIKYLKDNLVNIENEFKELGIEFDYTFKPFLNQDDNNPKKTVKNKKDAKVELKCPYPWERIFIDYLGRIKPDCWCDIPVGNILDAQIDDIWNNQKMQIYRQRIMEGSPRGWCTDICVANAVEAKKFRTF